MNNTSHPMNITEMNNRTKRFDSAGTPESPFRSLLLNLCKKHLTNKADLCKKL